MNLILNNMQKLTLSELQDLSLSILQEVHLFCVKNNLKYSLAYGTLIGAIRHKGFIPWDDDVDIVMPRPDYERFCKSFVSDKCKVSSFGQDQDCRITYARVYDDNLTVVNSRIPWNLKEHGAWIDVFPVDAVEDDFDEYKSRFANISKRFAHIQFIRGALSRFSTDFDVMSNIKILVKKILYINAAVLPSKIKKVIEMSSLIPFGSTNHWGLVAFDSYGIKDYHENALFDDVVEVNFEQYRFHALIGYDEYLRNIYGDYMKLPPEEERHPKQTYLNVYWKSKK